MSIANLKHTDTLVSLLAGTIQAFEESKKPNKTLGSEFIVVQNNGIITSRSRRLGVLNGNVALKIYCKCNSNGTAKTTRLPELASECEKLVHCKSSNGYYFEVDADNVITPPTVNLSTGYATMAINVTWRTSK